MNFMIYNYFDQEYERPDVTSVSLIAKEIGGILFDYTSATFLNGYINYVDIIDAYGINRHNPYEPINPDALKQYHPCLSDYRDDVLLLAKSPNVDNSYFLFYYSINGGANDMIGNFITNDVVSVVIENFINYCNELNVWRNDGIEKKGLDIKDYPIIKLPKLNGWIKG